MKKFDCGPLLIFEATRDYYIAQPYTPYIVIEAETFTLASELYKNFLSVNFPNIYMREHVRHIDRQIND